MKKILKQGDILYVKSLDRFGRNYDLMLKEYRELIKEKGVIIHIIDMPFLSEINQLESLKGINTFLADIILEVLSFVADNERRLIKERQKEGILQAKLKGVKFGRPKIKSVSLEEVKELINSQKEKQMTVKEIINILNCSKAYFYKIKKELNLF